MKAFVTGATGFIGRNLVNKLADDGWDVSVLVRSKNDIKKFPSVKVGACHGDLLHLDLAKRKIEGTDVVFNLAGALPHHCSDSKIYWDTNTEGVRNILEVCKRSRIKRFIHVSTVGIYGPTPREGADENSPLRPESVYAESKAAGEDLVKEHYRKFQVPTVIIRPTIAFGPGDIRPGFSNLFPLIKKRLFIPVGDGSNYFHTVYVENLIEALLLAVVKKEAVGEDFIIGDDPCPTMKEVVDTICKVENVKLPPLFLPKALAYPLGAVGNVLQNLNLPTPLTTQRVRFITEEKRFKIDKAKKLLGYQAKVKLREGIERTYRWYEAKR